MKLSQIQFTLRDEYPELRETFSIFNEMVSKGNTAKVYIRKDSKTDDIYLCISIYRCKTAFSSVGIKRAILDSSISEVSEFMDLIPKGMYPYFADISGKKVSVAFYELFDYPKVEAVPISIPYQQNAFNDFLSLDFCTRKEFPHLLYLSNVANRLLARGAGCYLNIKETSPKSFFLNIRIMFKDLNFPSLHITVGLLADTLYNCHLLETSKINYVCSTPGIAPIRLEISDKYDKRHGYLVRLHVGNAFDKKIQENIENQCKILNAIFPR